MSSYYCILFGLSNRSEISTVFSKIEMLPHLALRSFFYDGRVNSPLVKMQNQKELETIKKLRTERSDMPKAKEQKIREPGNAIS